MFGNSFATDYLHIQLTILFYGIFFGISMPISQVIVGEIVPLKIRGRYIVLLQLIYIFGILYLQISCILFLKSFDSGNWRGLLRLNTLPGFFCLFLTLLFLRESPRLLIAKGSFE
jgi:MFS family permease